MDILTIEIILVLLGTTFFSSLLITIFSTVFYIFYIMNKYTPIRNQILKTFPKEQLITEPMIQAEILRQYPEYLNINSKLFLFPIKIFVISFVSIFITILLSYIFLRN